MKSQSPQIGAILPTNIVNTLYTGLDMSQSPQIGAILPTNP